MRAKPNKKLAQRKSPAARSKKGTRRKKVLSVRLTEAEDTAARKIFGKHLCRVVRAFLLGQPVLQRSRLADDEIRLLMLALYAVYKVIERVFTQLERGDTGSALSLRPEFEATFKHLLQLCFKNFSQ